MVNGLTQEGSPHDSVCSKPSAQGVCCSVYSCQFGVICLIKKSKLTAESCLFHFARVDSQMADRPAIPELPKQFPCRGTDFSGKISGLFQGLLMRETGQVEIPDTY